MRISDWSPDVCSSDLAPEERPTYADRRLSNYEYLDEVGQSEREDPYYFAPSMARTILNCPHQELATHSCSHYYSLEPGQTDAQFTADLRAAVAQIGSTVWRESGCQYWWNMAVA